MYRTSTALFLASASLACSSAQPNPAPAPSADQRVAEVLAAAKRWTGTLNPTQGRTATVVTTTRQRAYGNVVLTVAPNRPTLTHVVLNVSVPMEPGLNNLGWSIHQGNCGSGSPPVMSPGAFPTMVVSTNGRGALEDDIAFRLPDFGSFHVNVFRGNGTQLSDVITCANLRKDT